MDYEKKYNETLERAREIYSDPKKALERNVNLTNEGTIAAIRVALLDLFKEEQLKCSEDERIRKMLVEQMKRWKKCAEDNNVEQDVKDASAAIAYLEKQKQYDIDVLEKRITKDSVSELPQAVIIRNGKEIVEANEQKPAEWSEEEKGILLECVSALQNSSHWLLADKLSSLRPQPKAEWSEEDKETLEKLHRLLVICRGEKKFIQEADYNKMDNLLKSFYSQSKQEWSEEDEKMLTEIINSVNGFDAFTGIILQNFEQHERKINWLKSLRHQPKQEWSEEDEKMLKVISYKISQHQGNDERSLFTPDEAEFIDGMEQNLKSLRPQPHWKPSDEQIRPLEYAIEYFKKKKNDTTYLESLLNDLNKL